METEERKEQILFAEVCESLKEFYSTVNYSDILETIAFAESWIISKSEERDEKPSRDTAESFYYLMQLVTRTKQIAQIAENKKKIVVPRPEAHSLMTEPQSDGQ